jgi:hypothetical protein
MDCPYCAAELLPQPKSALASTLVIVLSIVLAGLCADSLSLTHPIKGLLQFASGIAAGVLFYIFAMRYRTRPHPAMRDENKAARRIRNTEA